MRFISNDIENGDLCSIQLANEYPFLQIGRQDMAVLYAPWANSKMREPRNQPMPIFAFLLVSSEGARQGHLLLSLTTHQ